MIAPVLIALFAQAEPTEIRVIDGDTFEYRGETIRIANIDAPESGWRAECMAEAMLAERASTVLNTLLTFRGDPLIEFERQGADRYDRTLALVTVDGSDLGETMIEYGFAVEWTGNRADWCGNISE